MHIITPYDPYAPKRKKKTWQEEAWEQQQIAEIEARILEEAKAATVPSEPSPTVQSVAAAAGAAAGAGGIPEHAYFHPSVDVGSLIITGTQNGVAPYVASLSVSSTGYGSKYTIYNWNFSDGGTAGGSTVSHTFHTGTFHVSVTGSGAGGAELDSTGSVNYISASIPTVLASYTASAGSLVTGSVPLTVQFVNTTVNGLTYLWTFSGSTTPQITPVTTSTETNPSFTFYTPGRYTVRLGATGSYALTNATTSLYVSASIP